MAARPNRWLVATSQVAILAVMLASGVGGAARADEKIPAASWYIVGGPEHGPAVQGDGSGQDNRPRRVDFGVTFSGVTFSGIAAGDIITFTSGATSPGVDEPDGYSFLVSGAYDFETGTLVTPRIVGGVGVSNVGAGAAGRLAPADPTARSDMTPTARIGFGADFDLGDYWAVSAEYSAMYLAESEREGRLGESRLDQKFTVGAKVRF